ncbi:hypothetical protein ACVW1A_006144 [Bradyrhizobium sp. LB1.3]
MRTVASELPIADVLEYSLTEGKVVLPAEVFDDPSPIPKLDDWAGLKGSGTAVKKTA